MKAMKSKFERKHIKMTDSIQFQLCLFWYFPRTDTIWSVDTKFHIRLSRLPLSPLFCKYWFESKITRVQDLPDNNGYVLTFNQFPNNFNLTLSASILNQSSLSQPHEIEAMQKTFSSQTLNDKSKNSTNTISTKMFTHLKLSFL